MFNQSCTLTKLRTEIERRKGRVYWKYKIFGYLTYNYKNRKEEIKGKLTLQNKFKVIASRVIS